MDKQCEDPNGNEAQYLPQLSPVPGPSGTSSGPILAPELVTEKSQQPEDITLEECVLEDDILQILGDAPQAQSTLGKNTLKDIATRWQEILQNGLKKEIKDKLITDYLIPGNCSYLLAPLLNPEVKAAISELQSKRDQLMQQKQTQLGHALAALAKVTEMIIANETSKHKLLQPLSDACRLICDNHNAETKARRNIIMGSINVSLKEALADTTRDKLLFGEDVSEKLKTAKNVQKTGESLQKVNPKPPAKTNPVFNIKNFKARPNYKGQNRRTPNNRVENVQHRGVPPARPSRPIPRSNTYQPPRTFDRSPTRRTQRR